MKFERMLRLFFSAGMMMLTLSVMGQGKMTFIKEVHDFGHINEEDEFAEHTFIFTNTGNQPLKIATVKTSCGCTTPFWSKEEILPGDTGRVSARYNTINRPGPFNKSLQVSSDAENATVSLIIRGQVKPALRSVDRDLPARFGSLRMKYKSFNMGTITTERAVTKSFVVFNDSDSALTFFKAESPEHMVVRFVPDELESRQMGEIRIRYDPEKKNDLGYLSDSVKLVTSDVSEPVKTMYVIATLEEYFPIMNEEELATKPRLTFDKKLHDFKKVTQGDTAIVEFLMTNTGQDTLKIRKTMTNCSCTSSSLETNQLAPGEEAKLRVAFNTAGRKGQQFKNVSIFSNDPLAPTQMVSVKAMVEE